MKVIIGSDHGGFNLKNKIIEYLKLNEIETEDMGTYNTDSCDYPEIAKKVCYEVLKEPELKGILVCGSGVGMSITANKVRGIRAALCTNEYLAKMSRKHNNTNVLCLGERVTGAGVAMDIVKAWLTTDFDGGRHEKRVSMIEG
ncbi:ribose 5-phosphate isomerase B [bacterium]|nr:ribose 5-phosphate isomerase B [bacterium]